MSRAADDTELALPKWANMLDQEPAKPTRYRVRRLLGFAKPYRWQMAGLMVAVALNSSITLLYPALVGTAIDNVIVGRNTAVLPAGRATPQIPPVVWYSRRHSLASGRIIGAQWLVRKWLSTCALSYIATSNNYRSVSFRTTTPATC